MNTVARLYFAVPLILGPAAALSTVFKGTSQKWLSSTGAANVVVDSPVTSTFRRKSSMGIPKHLDENMLVGQHFVVHDDESSIVVEKVSANPPIFVLRNAISEQVCQHIMAMASASTFQPARTILSKNKSEVYRKACSVCWLENDNENGTLVRTMAQKAHSILMPHQIFHETQGVEALQVVKYEEQGEYVFHHDSNKRLLTVLYYLNGSGETWFPLADEPIDPELEPLHREQALLLCASRKPTESGVLVSCEGRGTRVQQGDAVAFFSYFSDQTVDWRSIHAGLPAQSTKWIGNHWYHYFPFSFPET